MSGIHLRKYGAQTTVDFQLFEIDGVDFRVDAVHAAGDSVIMKDEGAEVNTDNAFSDEGRGYSIVFTATEMEAARIVVYIVDQTATKAWLDTAITIETYGNASAQHAVDLDDGVRAGLTALPNAAADANNGLVTGDGNVTLTAGVGNRVAVDVEALGGTVQSAADLKDFADEGYDPATDKVQGVVLVDTTTTNTDVRGTDNAALAATALTDVTWTDVRAGYLDELAGANLPTDIADIPTVAEFEARTIVSADYFDPGADAVADVTTVGTTTTNTDMRGTDNGALASVCTEARLAELAAANLPTDIADIPTVAEFNARTIPSADYFDPAADTVVDVTTVGTTTTNTDMRGTDGANTVTPLSAAQTESEVNDALVALKLDHLVAVADGDDPVDNSIVAKLAAGDGDWSGFVPADDSQEAIRDRGDAAWGTGAAAPTATAIVDEWEAQSQADPTGFHVNVQEIAGTAQTANDNGADLNTLISRVTAAVALASVCTEARLAELGATNLPADVDTLLTRLSVANAQALADWINGGRLDLILDAIAGDVVNLDGATMRGTDNAALAATALSTADWTAARAGYLDELEAANIPADIDTLLTRVTAAVALASVCTEGRLAELDAGNLPADIAAIPTSGENASAAADEVLTGATHNIVNSWGRRVRELDEQIGYQDGAIWIDTVNGVAGSVVGENGTVNNPVDNITDALSLAVAIGITRMRVASGSTVTLLAATEGYEIFNANWTLVLNGQSISGSCISGAAASGISTGASQPQFINCRLGAVTLPPAIFKDCGIGSGGGTFTAGSAGEYVFDGCYSLVPGSGTPAFVMTGLGAATGVNNRGWRGGATYTLDSDVTLSHEVLAGGGTTITTGGANVEIRGITRSVTLVLSGAGTVQFVGITGPIAISGTATTVVNLYGIASTLSDASSGASVNDLTLSAAQVNAEVLDVLNVDTFAEPGQGAPAATTTLQEKIAYLYKLMRNKLEQTTTTLSIYNDAGAVVDQKATVSDDLTTFTRGEIGTGP